MEKDKGPVKVVGWDGKDDPANPRNFPALRKAVITSLGCAYTGLVSIGVSGFSIALASVEHELQTSRILALLGYEPVNIKDVSVS